MTTTASKHPNYRRPDTLELTEDPAANALVATDPMAFLIGWLLDQQVKVQQAFVGPLRIRERLGTLEPVQLARIPLERWEAAFTQKPAVHRYARNMAKRTLELARHVVGEYEGDPERIWLDAADYAQLEQRVVALPGFGATKAPAFAAMLARRFGMDFTGFEDKLMPYGSLADVEQYADLLAYQERKRASKAAKRAATAE